MIELFGNAHFLRPGCLLLAPAVGIVWWWWLRQSDPLGAWRSKIDPDLLEALVVDEGGHNARRGRILLAAWLLVVIAAAGPTWRLEPNPFAASAPPLMILLKADASMADALTPPSPIERGQLKIHDLIGVHQGEPIGLIAYAGSAHLVMPSTRDSKVVAEMASQIDPDIMPMPGDRLDLAIREASRVLSGTEGGGSLLVVADGVNGDRSAIAAAHREAGSPPVQFLDLSRPESPASRSLSAVADSLNGVVQPWTVDEQDVTRIADRARRQSAAAIGGESSRWQEAGYWLTPAIVLLVALSFRRESSRAQGTME